MGGVGYIRKLKSPFDCVFAVSNISNIPTSVPSRFTRELLSLYQVLIINPVAYLIYDLKIQGHSYGTKDEP